MNRRPPRYREPWPHLFNPIEILVPVVLVVIVLCANASRLWHWITGA